MRTILGAAALALALGTAPMHAAMAAETVVVVAADDLVVVEVTPVSAELASHLKVAPESLPPSVELPSKLAAVVCDRSLKQLRDGGGRCVALGMSQGLIQAVRSAMRGG